MKGETAYNIMKNIPLELEKEYKNNQSIYKEVMEEIVQHLHRELSVLKFKMGVRSRVTDFRLKRLSKIWRNAKVKKINSEEILTKTEDLLGVRIVCNNLSDIEPIIEMLNNQIFLLKIVDVKRKSENGYKATHVRAIFHHRILNADIPCEVQVRTLAQDMWGRLSRSDLYSDNIVPNLIRKLSESLSTQLSAIDEIAQLIRDEMNKCPDVAEEIKDTDKIAPQTLSLLYKDLYKEDIYEWDLIDWIKQLEEVGVENIGEVKSILKDTKIRKILEEYSHEVRNHSLWNSEWTLYSALIESETRKAYGIDKVKQLIKSEWEEIASTAISEVLSDLPETIEGLIIDISKDDFSRETFGNLGLLRPCVRCGTKIIPIEEAVSKISDFYDNYDYNQELYGLLIELPDSSSVDCQSVCQYCGYKKSKDE